ncbi:MAG: hypothetical protein K2I87_04490 [Bacteroidales bacterium]|nr:hypothetical protein [Bacteroidales bacterium]
MKALNWILRISPIVIMLSGCDYPREYRIFLTEIGEQAIPYRDFKVIHFIDNNEMFATMEVNEDKTFWKEDGEYSTHFVWECRKVHLSSEQCDLQFNIIVESLDWYVPLNVCVKTSSGDVFRVYYDIMGLLGTYDSLEINRHVYYDVAVVKDCAGKDSKLYYNTDYGILQVTQNDKDIFTLVP